LGLLNLQSLIRKIQVVGVLEVNSATCYTSVKIIFGVARVQKDPIKITASVPVKVQHLEELSLVFQINFG
jgi:hypothetical protein